MVKHNRNSLIASKSTWWHLFFFLFPVEQNASSVQNFMLKAGKEFVQGPISAFEAGQRACLTEEEKKTHQG